MEYVAVLFGYRASYSREAKKVTFTTTWGNSPRGGVKRGEWPALARQRSWTAL